MQRPDWVDSELYPFQDHWADVGGCSVHYVDEGSGPPLLMLHGNPTWSFTWREVIKGVRDRYRCVALDLPGFGLSTAPDGYGFSPPEHARVVEAFVEQLDLRDSTLLVQDWGGPIGFAVAAHQPERFTAFAIGNTWAWPMTGNVGARIFSAFLGGPIGGYLIKRRNFFVEKIIPGGTKRVGPDERVMEHYRRPFPTPQSRVPMHVFPRAIIGETPWLREVEQGLASIDDRPALIVWPTRDQAFGQRERERWESTFADHRTVTLEGAGHYIGEDAPQEIVAALTEWASSRV
ncbi:MAG: haloalkane dehalogenase [Thermoleophilaceae bacterium]|nr:haloalkane dehalogenase [Thermoleophilaceae bacterium]